MYRYLNMLAKDVLRTEPDGISKVRFAKILYFVHKGLVQQSIVAAKELQFIRMPLGPVPVGFQQLTEDPMIQVSEVASSLTYNTQLYSLCDDSVHGSSKYERHIRRIVEHLKLLPTSELVEFSHEERSWLHFQNGEKYSISVKDLQQPLPTRQTSSDISEEIDEQHIQARLVAGMLHDIVEESTALEYP